MKRTIIYVFIILILGLIYFLIEPMAGYLVGWHSLPAAQRDLAAEGQKDSAYSDAIKAAAVVMQKAQQQLQAPALSIAVGIDNKIVWSSAIGYKNMERQEPADTGTSFRIGSTSKAITSLLLGKLLEQGKLHLDTAVQRYAPYVSIAAPITIRQLASHTSGIRNYGWCFCFPASEYFNNDEHETIEESVNVFQKDPLLFAPGHGYSYSTYNFTLLSAAIEETARMKFTDFARSEIFVPLHMQNTFADEAGKEIESRATFYEVKDGYYKNVYAVNNSNKWAGGGFVSTPQDMVKFGNAVLSQALVSQPTLDTLFTPQRLYDGTLNEEGYALGWRVSKEKMLFNGREATYIVHHGGTALGSTSFLVLFPDHHLVVSMLMNRDAPEDFRNFSNYAFDIAEAFISLHNMREH